MRTESVVTGDCVRKLRELPGGSAQLVFADPPFNIGFEYDTYRDSKPPAEYLSWCDQWLAECYRVLAPSGSMWVAIGDEYAAEIKTRLDGLGLHWRNWLIWHYTFGVHCAGKFSRCHAHILYYCKDRDRRTWHPERINQVSTRMEIGDKRAAEKGKTPPDVWTESRVCGTFGERVKAEGNDKSGYPCQMPEAILRRIIAVATEPGELVVDPFGGSGTTAAVAKKLGRSYWTCELSVAYAQLIRERLAAPTVFDDDGDDMTELAGDLGLT